MIEWLLGAFLGLQLVASSGLFRRLARGRKRYPKLSPPGDHSAPMEDKITIVIPARNEARRVRLCLEGAIAQGAVVRQILVVDDESTDATAQVVRSFADPRIEIIAGTPLPRGWVGKPWALEQGLRRVETEWLLCLDADTRPAPGLAKAALIRALDERLDALSIAPRILVESRGERWLHPALLTTLIYRLGPGDASHGENGRQARRFANGQCVLFRTSSLRRIGGFVASRAAFAEDVVMASHFSRRGLRFGFRNGSDLLAVKMYGSAIETWREWGRTLGLNEATSLTRQLRDIVSLFLTQAAPLPALFAAALWPESPGRWSWAVVGLNAPLLLVRLGLLYATAQNYGPAAGVYWLSPLADLPAVVRVTISAVRPLPVWKGRRYTRPRLFERKIPAGRKRIRRAPT